MLSFLQKDSPCSNYNETIILQSGLPIYFYMAAHAEIVLELRMDII